MDDGIEILVAEDILQGPAITQVGLDEPRRAPRDLADPAEGLFLAVAEIVDHHDLMAGRQQLDTGVAADVARAACHQYPHDTNLSFGGNPS